MNVSYELDLNTFEAWSGAVYTINRVREEGKCGELQYVLEELYPDGMTETQLNDLLWFEREWLYETLGISNEEEDEEQ